MGLALSSKIGMPITQSAKKALRKSQRRRTRNLARKSALVSVIKKIRKSIAAGNAAQAEKLFSEAQKTIDKTAKAGLIKKNTAARKKSRLARLLKKSARSA